jgi:hypothetical protein
MATSLYKDQQGMPDLISGTAHSSCAQGLLLEVYEAAST